MNLIEAKNIADSIQGRGQQVQFTTEQVREAIRLLERTGTGRKTQRAWDRLNTRLNALRPLLGEG